MFTKQHLFGSKPGLPDSGNCFQCAISAVMGLEIDCVPHFLQNSEDNSENLRFLVDWLAGRDAFLVQYNYDMYKEHLLVTKFFGFADGTLFVLSGKSPRFECDHAVVAEVCSTDPRGYRLVFDPHPSDDFIEGTPTLVEFIVRPYNPMKYKQACDSGDAGAKVVPLAPTPQPGA